MTDYGAFAPAALSWPRPKQMEQTTQINPLKSKSVMATLISDITGEDMELVARKLAVEYRHPGRTVAEDFKRHGGVKYTWGPSMEAFYGSTSAFLYELALWNRNPLKMSTRRFVSRHLALQGKPLDILCVGDGLGFDSLHFARKHRVTYFELPGVSERFARQLFERSTTTIRVLTDPAEIPKEAFDAVTCFDVLEHVPDPPAMVRQLASYLRPGGMLYVSAPFYMLFPWYPTHLRSNRKFSGSLELYRQAGLQLVGGRFTWYPITLRKPDGSPPPHHPVAVPAIRLSAKAQAIGRWTAWPFIWVHAMRWACSRKL